MILLKNRPQPPSQSECATSESRLFTFLILSERINDFVDEALHRVFGWEMNILAVQVDPNMTDLINARYCLQRSPCTLF